MHNFKELKVWNKSMDVVVKVYEATSVFPTEEKYNEIEEIQKMNYKLQERKRY